METEKEGITVVCLYVAVNRMRKGRVDFKVHHRNDVKLEDGYEWSKDEKDRHRTRTQTIPKGMTAEELCRKLNSDLVS